MFVLLKLSKESFTLCISLNLDCIKFTFWKFIPVRAGGFVDVYETLKHISWYILDIKSNMSDKDVINSSDNTADCLGRVLSNSKPKYILGEFTINLLSFSSGLVSKWKLPLVLNPIALSENYIVGDNTRKTSLSSNTWFPWYVPGACGM